ncbi:MAG: MATE family efflux transporter [Spirochaetia bacterium]|jgi:putative MATE family efflux protein|nr:MATE family efflux transporter [Spirochaetia bacterium]
MTHRLAVSPNITEGNIPRALLSFFLPIMLGTFFQQLYNTSDAIIVGKFLGKQALAAVGGGSGVLINILLGFFVGLAGGASILISQQFGAGHKEKVGKSTHTAVAIAIICGLIITVVGIEFSAPALSLIDTPKDLFVPTQTYLSIFFIGSLPLSLYNMGAGILRAIGDSRRPFYVLLVGTIVNIVLDFIFIGVLQLGIAGAAWATVLSETISCIILFVILTKSKECYQVEIRKIRLYKESFAPMLALGIPTGIQSSLYTISNIIIQAFINRLDTETIAAWAAYGKLDSFFWMTISALGIATTTFAGQNYGAGKIDRVRQGTKVSLLFAIVATFAIGIPYYIFSPQLIGLFINAPSVIDAGVQIMRFLVPTYITYIAIEILSGTIRGCGKTVPPTLITVFGICILRIIYLFAFVPQEGSILDIILSYPFTWTITTIIFIIYYKKGRWMRVIPPKTQKPPQKKFGKPRLSA